MKHYTSTSNALQKYYRQRHVKREEPQLKKEQDKSNTAMQARDFIQGFSRKHNGKSKRQFVKWLLK